MNTEKVKQSLYRPGQVLRVPEGRGSLISRPLVHEGGKVVKSARWPRLPSRKYPIVKGACDFPHCGVVPESTVLHVATAEYRLGLNVNQQRILITSVQ
jgi:hypothetical protein